MFTDQSTGPSKQLNMTVEEKLKTSRNYKEKGNDFYKAKKYKSAIRKYHCALLYVKGIERHNDKYKLPGMFGAARGMTVDENALSEEMEVELQNLKASCYNNLAACLLQQENANYEKIIHYCNEVLSLDPKNVKALYRKGISYFHLKDYDQCLKTLQEAKALSSSADASIQRYINLSEKHLNLYMEKEKERYKGMFEKLANVDLQTSV